MVTRWIRRKAHSRLTKSGRVVSVRECWAPYDNDEQKRDSYRHRCHYCNAFVLTVRMPNGGLGHFENGQGLGRIKHACYYQGENLLKERDDKTRDLFEPNN